MFEIISLLLAGYAAGSIPFGFIIARQYGVNIQKRGSGNIGFANVRRVLGWPAGIVTLIGDIAKGIVPTLATSILLENPTVTFFVGLAAIAGHIFPVWLRFKGGKGIATGLGVVAVLSPIAAIVGGVSYILGCIFLKSSSISSIIAATLLAAVGVYVLPSLWWQFVALLCIAGWTLRHNFNGTVPDYDI